MTESNNENLDVQNIKITEDIYNQILEDKEKYTDYNSLPGNFKKAHAHFKACQFYKKSYFDKIENIKFCDDCLNPIPDEDEAAKPEKYPFCTPKKSIAELGTGVFLYFYFIQFIFFICVLLMGIVAYVQIFISSKYHNEMVSYCSYYARTNDTEICQNFQNVTVNNTDWIYQMSYQNMGKYITFNIFRIL